MVPRTILMKSGLVSINTARQNISKTAVSVNTARKVNTAHSKTTVNAGRPMPKAVVNVARPKAVVNVVKRNNVNAVKASACLDKGVIDSECSRHMTRNMFYLTDYEEIDGGYVAFGGNPKGGKITEKGTIKTGNLDFENVYVVWNGIRVNAGDSKLMLLGITYCCWLLLSRRKLSIVDEKKIIISKSIVRRYLQLEDAEGVDCLPNASIFEQLTVMGSRRSKRKDTEVPQPSGPKTNIADDAVNEEMDDSLEMAATTNTGLEAK
ncbi:hypothetical protein Tco_0938934 [Tanacetum coccineum]|uniref:Uncharacterized protein n=1 Tax=Tanacetum coccineum TaxID=301880 RepID=A0ABQ5DQK4_9ASTR